VPETQKDFKVSALYYFCVSGTNLLMAQLDSQNML
jgi:hypothetical protein